MAKLLMSTKKHLVQRLVKSFIEIIEIKSTGINLSVIYKMTPLEEWMTEQVNEPDCPAHLRDIYHEMYGKAKTPWWAWLMNK